MKNLDSLLLVSSSLPGAQHVGGILLQDMLTVVHERDVQIANVTISEHAQRRAPGLRGSLQTLWDRKFRYQPEIKQAATRICRRIQDEKPKQLWAVLESTAVIDATWLIQKNTDVPLLTHVWDDPLHLLRQRRLDRITIGQTLNRFRKLLQTSERVAVICEQMADEYRKLGARECVVIRHGLKSEVSPKTAQPNPDKFRLGFCGSMYCFDAWRALLNALDSINWRLDGRQIELWTIGADISFKSSAAADCRFFGWRSVDETARLLEQCDLLYLPQPFDWLNEPLARLSFPTKLSTYAATGRPVFIHTPEWGSLNNFGRANQMELICNSTVPADVVSMLSKIESQPGLLDREASNSARIANTVLSFPEFARQTKAFLSP